MSSTNATVNLLGNFTAMKHCNSLAPYQSHHIFIVSTSLYNVVLYKCHSVITYIFLPLLYHVHCYNQCMNLSNIAKQNIIHVSRQAFVMSTLTMLLQV